MRRKNTFKQLVLLGFISFIGLNAQYSWGQTKNLANSVTSNTSSNPLSTNYNIVEGQNEVLNTNNTFATVKSKAGLIAGLLGASGELTLNHTTQIPANTDYYLKLESDGGTLDGLVGGGLGQLVTGLLNSLLLGDHYFGVTVSGGSNTFTAYTDTRYNSTLDRARIVMDKNGRHYLKITPNFQFNSIKLTDYNAALIGALATVKSTRIYEGFYYTGNSECVEMMTYYDSSPSLLSLDLAGLGATGVTNPQFAIDSDLNTASEIGMGVLSVAGSLSQSFILPTTVNNTSKDIQVMLHLDDPTLLSLGVAEGVFIEAYNNGALVSSQQVNSDFLGLDLLGLINQGKKIMVRYKPTDAYDEIKITVKGLANVGVAKTVKIYDVAVVPSAPSINEAVCTFNGVFDLSTIIPNYSVSNTYTVLTYEGEVVTDMTQVPLGSYLVKGVTGSGYCADQYIHIIATKDATYKIEGKSAISVQQGNEVDFSALTYTTDLPTGSAVQIYDELTGQPVTGSVLFDQLGSYNYYARTVNAAQTCEIIKRITVFVYDMSTCDYRYIKKSATNITDWGTATLLGIPLGGTSDRTKAGDGDLSTHSTVFNVVSLLGIGTTWQDLKFESAPGTLQTVAAGTPVTIKLGQEYSLLQLIGAVTIRTLDSDGNAIGNLIDIGESDLLSLLVGDNIFEFTYVPTDNNGEPIPYSGVRVHLGSVLGVGNSMDIFGAYIDERIAATAANCETNIVVNGAATPSGLETTLTLNASAQDVLWGVKDAGLGVATALSGVVYPYLAIDNDLETYARFNTAASVLNTQSLTVKFKELARPGDKVQIIMGSENIGVLNLGVLQQHFVFQRYLGDAPVGDPLTSADYSLINLNLLGLLGSTENKYAVIVNETNVPFDRIDISYTNIVNVELLGEYTYIYDVALVPYIAFDESVGTTTLCTSVPLEIEKLDPCTTYTLSFAYATKDNNGNITAWNDIAGSELTVLPGDSTDPTFKYALTEMYKQYSAVDNLYLKVITNRQHCVYGNTQYLSVKIESCKTIVNPMIRTRLNSN